MKFALDMSMISWLVFAVPLLGVIFATLTFMVRWYRANRRTEMDSGQLLIGAVSQSLRERGELAASLGQLRTVHERILDTLPLGVLWVDRHQCVAAINGEGRRLLGVKPGVIGLKVAFVLEPFPWLLDAVSRTPGPAWTCEAGERRWRIQRLEGADKVGALVLFEDITEAEQAERRRQLRERFAELGEMTAGVAHQLKNGLAVLRGRGQLMLKAGQTEAAEDILVETESLERLVQRFLQWAKPLEPHLADLNLVDVVAAAVTEVRKRPQAMGRELHFSGAGRAMADAMLLQQALVNLLENACEATPPGSQVMVEVGPNRITINDQGPGLTDEALARVMRPFESGRPDGTGLGLPLALKWVTAQGAELQLHRRPEGGTCAEVHW